MLTARLKKIIEFVPDNVGVADIGTDHAYIPIYLARRTHCRPIIAGENNIGPYQIALERIRKERLEKNIELRFGSGLTILQPDEVDVAIIAGMGFNTIIEILTESEELARSLKSLIIQPMQGVDKLRNWLNHNSYIIKDESLVKEDGKLFQIIVIKSGKTDKLNDILYEVGPVLFNKKEPYFKEHISELIRKYHERLLKISSLEGEQARIIKAELQQKLAILEEVLEIWVKKFNE